MKKEEASKKPRVLIVEDDPESVELLEILFQKKGYHVVGRAHDGRTAVSEYKRLHPDIVTMDIMMPSVDGRACTKDILEYDPNANIVVVSVLGQDELETLKTLGVRAFVKKPFNIEELFKAIINLSVSLVRDESGRELGAVSVAKAVNGNVTSSGLFIDILHHDLLNPVGLIKNFAELMSEGTPEALRPQLEAILRNTERLIELIDDANSLSKLEQLRKLEPQKIDLAQLIESALTDLKPSIDIKKIKIVNNVKGPYSILADLRIEGVVSNLLSNAVKFSPDGGEVGVDAKLEEGDLLFSVSDQGPGVKDEHKESIFQRFERIKKEGVRGTGIGLAIVKRITELHKGKVWVEDNPDGGSIFKVWIPGGGRGV